MFIGSGPVFAQSDYSSFVREGDKAVAKGDYDEAAKQYDGALALMGMKKMDKNSTEYMGIERKLNGAKNCLAWSKAVHSGLESLSEAAIISRFENAADGDEMERIKKDLMNKVNAVQTNINNILQRFPSDKVTAGKKSQCARISNIIQTAIDNREELLAWADHRNRNTLEAYNEFLSQYPNGKYQAAARDSILSLQEVQAWASLSRDQSEDALQEYVQQFPSGKHVQEVKAQLDQIQLKRKDDNAWEDAVRKGTSLAFKQYTDNFPQGLHRSEANRKFKEAASNEDDAAWNEADKISTIDAYRKYLAQYPNGRHANDAKKGEDRISDRKVWDKYRQIDTREAYQAYLSESKLRVFEAEARKRIKDIDLEEKQAEEETLWAAAIQQGTEDSFRNYLIASSLKSHEKEANRMVSLRHAQALKASGASPDALVQAYAEAEKLGALSGQDKVDYEVAKDESAYLRFQLNPNEAQGKTYLSAFPQGKHATEVSDAIATSLADKLTWQSSNSDYQEALGYAVSTKTKNYVDGKFEKAQKEYQKILRKQNKEPFHFMLGIGAESVFDVFQTFTDYLSEGTIPNPGVKAALSFGGHSNRFNLELSGAYYNFLDADFSSPAVPYYKLRFSATPRVNIVKKHNNGSKYSAGYLYVAPEASYDLYNYDFNASSVSAGVKVGFGLSVIDVYAGYHYIVNTSMPDFDPSDPFYNFEFWPQQYLTVGVMLYFSGK